MMDALLERLIERHPEEAEQIALQFRNDPVFRSICEEMEIAEQAMGRWKDVPARAAEYEEIFNGLSSEFRACLAHPGQHTPTG